MPVAPSSENGEVMRSMTLLSGILCHIAESLVYLEFYEGSELGRLLYRDDISLEISAEQCPLLWAFA
jgi:hypothetical protein